ncbi:MAG: hypothetical protein ACR2MB_05510 [Acidimicrobiales bacterium]
MPSPLRRILVGVALVGPASWTLVSCGLHQGRTALAIQSARRPNATVLLKVECADDIEIDEGPDPAGSGLEQVTVSGRPRVGRCHPSIGLNDLGGDRFVDGATGQVVEVSPSNLD